MSFSFNLRPSCPDDWPFIASSFAHEYQSTTLLGNDDFKRLVMPAFEATFKRSTTFVAYPPSEPTEIAGWIAFTPTALVFGLVKRSYRSMGVWRFLLEQTSRKLYEWPLVFKPRRFADPGFIAAPWLALV